MPYNQRKEMPCNRETLRGVHSASARMNASSKSAKGQLSGALQKSARSILLLYDIRMIAIIIISSSSGISIVGFVLILTIIISSSSSSSRSSRMIMIVIRSSMYLSSGSRRGARAARWPARPASTP